MRLVGGCHGRPPLRGEGSLPTRPRDPVSLPQPQGSPCSGGRHLSGSVWLLRLADGPQMCFNFGTFVEVDDGICTVLFCRPWCCYPCANKESRELCHFWCWRRCSKGRNRYIDSSGQLRARRHEQAAPLITKEDYLSAKEWVAVTWPRPGECCHCARLTLVFPPQPAPTGANRRTRPSVAPSSVCARHGLWGIR